MTCISRWALAGGLPLLAARNRTLTRAGWLPAAVPIRSSLSYWHLLVGTTIVTTSNRFCRPRVARGKRGNEHRCDQSIDRPHFRVATLGKFGGTVLAARYAGESWRDAGVLGMLMNTRGLMELIVLNIGLDLGVISPTLFAMMVIMALVTTMMTSPVLGFLLPAERLSQAA
ncbi:MAG: cation:proton antiporter [Aureliella sp.]